MRKEHPEGRDPLGRERAGKLPCCPIRRLVTVVRDEHPLGPARLHRLEVLGSEAVDPVARGHVLEAGAPEAEGIDECLAQNQLVARSEGVEVPDTPVRAREVEVVRGAGSQVIPDLAAVHATHLPRRVENRDHEAAAQVLAAGVAVHAEVLEPLADHLAVEALLARQPQAQGAVCVAELEGGDRVGVVDAALLEVGQGFRRGLEGGVVVRDDLGEQLVVLGVEHDGRRQLEDGRLGHRRRAERRRRPPSAQDLDGVTKRHALGPPGPLDDVTAGIAREAVKQPLARRDDQGRRLVRTMKGTSSRQVLAVGPQLDPPRAYHGHQVVVPLDPLQLVVRDSTHQSPLSRNPVKTYMVSMVAG